ncbi:MAG: transcription-repair coupling factor [Epsilonproteobacteria bacterium]|nr:MAG: transcription-repair coupling factor [Campylobacterota bacterium]RLA65729.1 MAG: transcription-repair coupling factor [Campylobacterota bacterium]
MNYFESLNKKIENWYSSDIPKLKITGVETDQWAFFLQTFCESHYNLFENKSHFIICPTLDRAEALYQTLKVGMPQRSILLFPGLDFSPYADYIPSESNLLKRFEVLDTLARGDKGPIVLFTVESFLLRVPPRSFFLEGKFKIAVDDIISPDDLAHKLVSLGYSSSVSVEEPGTFSRKGEIFDLFPLSGPAIRLQYFDELIENIHGIDLETQKTNWDFNPKEVDVSPGPSIFSTAPYKDHLRENIPQAGPAFREKFEKRKELFHKISNHQLFEEYPAYIPLFFRHPETLFDYINPDETIITILDYHFSSQTFSELAEDLRVDFERVAQDTLNDNPLPGPDSLYNLEGFEKLESEPHIDLSSVDLTTQMDEDMGGKLELKLEGLKSYIDPRIGKSEDKYSYIKNILSFLNKFPGDVILSTHLESSKKEIQFLLEEYDELRAKIKFIHSDLPHGFHYPADKTIILTDGDIFSVKKTKTKKYSNARADLFAEQISTLKKGDYIIHSLHGIAQYQGLEMMGSGDQQADYLVLLYANGDKVYVPVYKINLIQKHGDSELNLKPDNLRTRKFDQLKDRAKKSIKKLAFDLLKLQAKRHTTESFSFSPPDHYFKEFELAFPFDETPDQARAIEDVLASMQKATPMDHLVCGDVGFGKTEVAMRAAFKAVLDKKQVAILVPTTILALQHYNSFKERFKGFPITIDFLSRFKTPSQIKEIKEKLKHGEIDIIIGTHTLIGSTIKFDDLGLVVVDEEQRFGVGHKEKLKLLRASVDFLTLTATPIPRTMQLAFLGLKELSLIQTAPPKRQSIKTYLIREDEQTLKIALEKELNRGGQVFIVHNRVRDIELIAENIKKLVPLAKILVAHGQLGERDLEKRMSAFYHGEYQILLSTTIIESGLDIPNANTMIIFNAQNFGLAQLHQLRGRIGRSDKKAYAYFVIPKNKNVGPLAEKRLKAIQTYADKGSGFSIASSDLENRGAGDILGGSQSGHIESIGLELYMKLLKEAIADLKGEKSTPKIDVEISTPFPAFIPESYITDSGERLKQYKKVANCDSLEKLESYQEDFTEIFGVPPKELRNLFTILEARITISYLGLKSIKVVGTSIILQFDQDYLQSREELRNQIIDSFLNRPNSYQFTPAFKLIYTSKKQVTEEEFLQFSKDIAQKIASC